MTHAAARVPSELLRRGLRVLRPQDASGVYAHPRAEFARLMHAGALHQLAPAYYAAVPDDRIGQDWKPALEAAAWGITAADQGVQQAAIMGVSAARLHGAIPRALGVAVIAATRHRRTLQLTDRDAQVLFVRRNTAALDLQRHRNELGDGWITSIEQTLLDLAARPTLGGLFDEAHAAIRALLPRTDRDLLADLANAQRRTPTLHRLLETNDHA